MPKKIVKKTPTKRQNGDKAAHLEPFRFKAGNKAAVGHGRPKTIPEIKELIQVIGDEGITNTNLTRLEAMVRLMFSSKSPEDRKTILKYGWGNPPMPIELPELSDEQLMKRARDLLESLGFINGLTDETTNGENHHADSD